MLHSSCAFVAASLSLIFLLFKVWIIHMLEMWRGWFRPIPEYYVN